MGVNTNNSTKFISQLVTRYIDAPFQEGIIISVNIPAGEHKGIAIRPMGDSYLDTTNYELISTSDSGQIYKRNIAVQVSENDETDTFAYQNGYITVTPLKFDWTSYESLEQIRGWNLELSN